MITKQKTWNIAAEEKVSRIFSKSYLNKLGTVHSSKVNMMYAFDYCLNKTNGLQVVDKDSLTTIHGWSLWDYLGAESLASLKMMSVDLTEKQMLDVLVSKQKDYGPNNIARFGSAGILIRIHDKLARYSNLFAKSDDNFNTAVMINSVQDETIVDTLIDIIGYSVVALMWDSIDEISGSPEFLLPME